MIPHTLTREQNKFLYEQMKDLSITLMPDNISTRLVPMAPFSKGKWILLCNVTYMYRGVSLSIPRNFVWDGASIPRIFWLTTGTPCDYAHILSGLIHDAMYEQKFNNDRKFCDECYRENLRKLGVSSYNVKKEYKAVRWFGGKHW